MRMVHRLTNKSTLSFNSSTLKPKERYFKTETVLF